MCEIFPTDAGQLSDRLKFWQDKTNSAGQEACLLSNYYLFLPEITGHLSDKLKFSAGQNENLLVLSDSPAVFVKTVLVVLCFSFIHSIFNMIMKKKGRSE